MAAKFGTNRKLEHGTRPGDINNFQARYAIRHPWFVARGFVTADAGEQLGIVAAVASPAGAEVQPLEPDASIPTVEANSEQSKGGCTCSSGATAPAFGLLGLFALLGVRRRVLS